MEGQRIRVLGLGLRLDDGWGGRSRWFWEERLGGELYSKRRFLTGFVGGLLIEGGSDEGE